MGGGGGLDGEARSRGLELGELGGSFFQSRAWLRLRFGRNLSLAALVSQCWLGAIGKPPCISEWPAWLVKAACFKEGEG